MFLGHLAGQHDIRTLVFSEIWGSSDSIHICSLFVCFFSPFLSVSIFVWIFAFATCKTRSHMRKVLDNLIYIARSISQQLKLLGQHVTNGQFHWQCHILLIRTSISWCQKHFNFNMTSRQQTQREHSDRDSPTIASCRVSNGTEFQQIPCLHATWFAGFNFMNKPVIGCCVCGCQ